MVSVARDCAMEFVGKEWEAEVRVAYLQLARSSLVAGLDFLDSSNQSIASNYVSMAIDLIDAEVSRLKAA